MREYLDKLCRDILIGLPVMGACMLIIGSLFATIVLNSWLFFFLFMFFLTVFGAACIGWLKGPE